MRVSVRMLAATLCLALGLISSLHSTVFAGPQGTVVTVSGSAFLSNTSNHSGIQVLFQAISASAETDSVVTNSAGYFDRTLNVGVYDVVYSKSGYVPHQIPGGRFFVADTTLADVTLEPGDVRTISGDLGGTLPGNTVYFVEGDIFVPTDSTLIIQAGASFRFTGDYKFEISGLLIAQGAEGDSITFTSIKPVPIPGDWQGIQFLSGSDSSCTLAYCRVQFAVDAIYCAYASPNLQHSVFQYSSSRGVYCYNSSPTFSQCTVLSNNSHGIHCFFSSPTITQCTVQNNSGIGIYCNELSSPKLTQCVVLGCAAGIVCVTNSSPTIAQCIVRNNNGRGVECIDSSSPSITSCTVKENNGDGIRCDQSSPTITQCIVQDNNNSGIECSFSAAPSITLCTVQSNSGSGIYAQSSFPSTVSGNIIRDNQYGFYLTGTSILGNVEYNDVFENTTDFSGSGFPQGLGNVITTNANGDSCDTYFNIFFDPMQVDPDSGDVSLLPGSPCIDAGDLAMALDPDGTIADIGALYYDQGSPPPAPVCDFSGSPTSGNVPFPVTFTNLSSGAITDYFWNFGDGRTNALREPIHYYIDPGFHTVSLTVTGPGGSCIETKSFYITAFPDTDPPQAEFSATPTSGYACLDVAFTDLTLGSVDVLWWYFGDGDSSNVTNPIHTFCVPDTYTVRLVAHGPFGVGEEIKTDYIVVLPQPPVLADFSATPAAGIPPLAVTFSDLSLGNLLDTWEWTFGDGDSSTLQNPIHVYNNPGAYDVTLRVAGPGGADTLTRQNYVRVYQEAPTILGINDIPGDQGGKVEVNWLGSGYDGPIGAQIVGYNVWQWYQNDWTMVGSALANQDSLYRYHAGTLQDSTDSGTGWTTFMVSAHGIDPALIYYSSPDSGYSIDNLPPSIPANLAPSVIDGLPLKLIWDPVPENDFRYYAVYRDSTSGFMPSMANRQDTTVDPEWTDPQFGTADFYFYRVIAFDFAGNASDPSNEVAVPRSSSLGGLNPSRFRLSQNAPNPFGPTTTIRYALPEASTVTFSFYSVAGREVARFAEDRDRGDHEFTWSGRNQDNRTLASGVYFYRMEAAPFSGNPRFVKQRKLMFVR